MKDSAALLLSAFLIALFGWSFWHFLGGNALQTLSMIAMLVLGIDNQRLRRKLRESEKHA